MEKSFLQSDQWAEFQRSLSYQVFQLGRVYIFQHNLPLSKSYLYCPHPTLFEIEQGGGFERFLLQIKEIAKKTNAIFFKIEPCEAVDFKKTKLLASLGMIKSHEIQPKRSLILNLSDSKEELLSKFHYKTRYNINLAKRKGVIVKTFTKKDYKKYFEDFWILINKTAKRDGFRPHIKKHYQNLLEVFNAELFVAEYQNKIIAANIVVFYNQTAIYLHGASDYEYRNVMAAPLLQWEQIKEAKKRGCIQYDFWGIDEKKWPGITRFKKSFGGKEIEYLGAYDLVFQPLWYGVYKVARMIL